MKVSREEFEKYKSGELQAHCHKCGKPLECKDHWSWRGIPDYCWGHNNHENGMKGKHHSEETKVQMHISAQTRPRRTDEDKERQRITLGSEKEGPTWYRKYKDLIERAVLLFQISYEEAKIVIRNELYEKKLSKLDILIFMNFAIGHNQLELAEKYNCSIVEVSNSLKRMRKVYPNVFQDSHVGFYNFLCFDLVNEALGYHKF